MWFTKRVMMEMVFRPKVLSIKIPIYKSEEIMKEEITMARVIMEVDIVMGTVMEVVTSFTDNEF